MTNPNWKLEHIPNIEGKRIIITGASSGLGKEATRVLASRDTSIIMAVRNIKKGKEVKKDILNNFSHADIRIIELDLASLASIKQFSDTIIKDYDQLDILINNAGVMMCPYSKTEDGFEIQMGTNHFGHFALTGHLLPLLKKTKGSRIVSTSSLAHTSGNIDFSDINWEERKYKTGKAYGDSKLANLYFTYELARKLERDPNAPQVMVAHPGWTSTDLQQHAGFMRLLNPVLSQGVDKGVLPTLRAAFDPEAQSGDYFGPAKFFGMHGNPVKVKSNERSYEEESAKQLWDLSEELTGVAY